MRLFTTIALITAAAGTLHVPPTIYLAGDSTMAHKQENKRPETGWGEELPQFFKSGEIRISNHAMNGRSTGSFIREGRWQAIVDSVEDGDYVFIQFGHNDESKDKGDRYTPIDAYRANLIRMVEDVRRRHATPVLLTPVYRRSFDKAGHIVDTHGAYPDTVRAVAAEYHVALIDMHRTSGELLQRLGRDSSTLLFLQLEPGQNANYPVGVHDNTHFRPYGATEMARLAAEGIRALKGDLAEKLLPAR